MHRPHDPAVRWFAHRETYMPHAVGLRGPLCGVKPASLSEGTELVGYPPGRTCRACQTKLIELREANSDSFRTRIGRVVRSICAEDDNVIGSVKQRTGEELMALELELLLWETGGGSEDLVAVGDATVRFLAAVQMQVRAVCS